MGTFLLLAVVVLSGCAAKPAPPPASTGTVEVSMKNLKFDPMEVTIKVGSTVQWMNNDSMSHDVTGENMAWQSTGGAGGMKPHDVFNKTFDAAGTYKFYCTLHSGGPGNGMSGTVTVVA